MNEEKSKSQSTSSPSNVSRRSVLKALGLGVAGAGTVATDRVVAGPTDKTVRIPKYKKGDKVVAWSEVDAEWWNHVQQSREIFRAFADRFGGKAGISYLERGTTDQRTIGGMGTNVIDVSVGPEQNPAETRRALGLESEFQGLPVRIKQSKVTNTAYKQDYDPVIGGVVMNSNVGTGSLTCRVEHDGVLHMMAARHVYIDDDSVKEDRCSKNDIVGKKSFQNNDFYGRVKHHWRQHDAAISERNSYFGNRSSFDNTIVDQSGVIDGHVAQSRLEALKDEFGDNMQKRGIGSGARSGTVIGTDGTDYCADFSQQKHRVRCDSFQTGGDSGGPMYEVVEFNNNTYLYIIGPATQRNSNYDALGSAAWWIHDNAGVTFNT